MVELVPISSGLWVPPAGECLRRQVLRIDSSAGRHKEDGLPTLRCLSVLPSVVRSLADLFQSSVCGADSFLDLN
ncbi:hypothetical protein ATANTOWER_017822 [Ataeniobius toweri]|uniref:Uncharacterized protein n=1 Tax=Ataeniobius toweri TaxID=208326 RepID=A0ABU7AR60_9TELE|nr:hypothetical protein [Ataeniobius toweri]